MLTSYIAAFIAETNEKILIRLIDAGKIRAMIASGAIFVNENDFLAALPKEEQLEYKKYASLAGQSIGMREASRKYSINHKTISRWVERGIIKTLGRAGRKVLIDAADMAYCAEIYHGKHASQGRWVFTSQGSPYTKKS